MATPVEWLGNFQVNTGGAATGGQSDARTIGLSNGNILVAWTEAADGSIGTSAGTDIVGQLLDSEGNAIGAAFQLNGFFTFDDEGDFDIAATNDGGWVMVFIDNSISNVNQSSVIWERFDSSGASFNFATIADENVAADVLANPKVAVDLTNNLSFVTYTDDVGADTDINGVTVDSGAVSAEFAAAQNSANFDRDGDVAVLSNGNFVSVYEEDDVGTSSIEFRVTDTAGTSVALITVDAGPAFAPKVASLAGGGFVVVWHEIVGSANSIMFQRYDNTGVAVGVAVNATNNTDEENEADVVALADGGFVVVWDNDTDSTVEARRFTSGGVGDGAVFVTNAVNGFAPSAGLTADGRLLFATNDGDGGGEVFASIWDPRGSTINATDYNNFSTNFLSTNVITGGPGATTINGNVPSVTLLGQAGNDTIVGGPFNQTIRGGGGDDSIAGGATFVNPVSGTADSIDGGAGNDTIVGATGDDTLRGGDNVDSIVGGEGDDRIDGGFDGDTLRGGQGNDTIFAAELVNSGISDLIFGNSGDDSLVGDGADAMDGGVDGGSDWASYAGAAARVFADLQAPGTNQGDAVGDSYVSIENLLGTTRNDALRGDTANNILDGGDKNDVLNGRIGDDTLIGGEGADRLKGAKGNDEYHLLDVAEGGFDRIYGYDGADDLLVVDGAAFGGLPPGALAPGRFVVGNQAGDLSDRFIYDDASGKLFFDADGSGAGAKVLIARFAGNPPALDASDFLVI